MNLVTDQRAQRRDRTNVYMCHVDHLLQLPWAHRRRVPPTEAARLKLNLRMTSIAARVKPKRPSAKANYRMCRLPVYLPVRYRNRPASRRVAEMKRALQVFSGLNADSDGRPWHCHCPD
jgi:hypothetical protein